MAKSTGDQAWFGFGEEDSYTGTSSMDKFLRIISATSGIGQEILSNPSLSEHEIDPVLGRTKAAPAITFRVPWTGAEVLFALACGDPATNLSTSVIEASTVWEHTISLERALGSFAGELCLDPVKSIDYTGLKANGLTFAQSSPGYLQATVPMIGQSFEESTSTAESFPADAGPIWSQYGLYIDDSLVTTNDIFGVEWTMANGLRDDAHDLKSARTIVEPERGAKRSITTSWDTEFANTTDYDKWLAGTSVKVEHRWTGGLVTGSATNNYHLKLINYDVRYKGDPIDVSDYGPTPQRLTGTAFYSTGDSKTAEIKIQNATETPIPA